MKTKIRPALFLLSPLLVVMLSITLVGAANAHQAQASSTPLQYVALGDSLPFGYQPSNDFTHGYANDLFQTLQAKANYGTLANLSCVGDSTTTFINGQSASSLRGCLNPQVQSSNQLSAAVAYIHQNASTIGLVTLQVGIDNFLTNGAINPTNCAINTTIFNTQLSIVDHDLTKTILPQIKQALNSAPSHHAHLALIGYYDPLSIICPNTTAYLKTLNKHLEKDSDGIASFVDIYKLFNNTNFCQATWICSGDIHPTSLGYTLIANRIYEHVFHKHVA